MNEYNQVRKSLTRTPRSIVDLLVFIVRELNASTVFYDWPCSRVRDDANLFLRLIRALVIFIRSTIVTSRAGTHTHTHTEQ